MEEFIIEDPTIYCRKCKKDVKVNDCEYFCKKCTNWRTHCPIMCDTCYNNRARVLYAQYAKKRKSFYYDK